MGRWRRCLVAGGMLAAATVALAVPTDARAPAPALFPGGGRALAAPLVLGASELGQGALDTLNGVTTGEVSSFDDAPPQLSLRTFSFVIDPAGGYSAVLRYRVPIVQLRAWRDHVVHFTQTIVLTSPDGTVQAVQMQEDGSVATGALDGTTFTPTGTSEGRMEGNVVALAIPASLGVTADWTVQAIVRVESDTPFGSVRPVTGFLAGTSIVPVGVLSGEGEATIAGFPSARFTLDQASSAEAPSTGEIVVTAVRVEGEGADRVIAVDTASSPLDVAATSGARIQLSLAGPMFRSMDDPVIMGWSRGVESDTQVRVSGVNVGTVHVTATDEGLRFAVGAMQLAPAVTIEAGTRLDTLHATLTVGLAADGDIVHSDGNSVRPDVVDTIIEEFDGPRVTVTHPSTGAVATGFVDADGTFIATSDTEHFVGVIDAFSNSVVNLSRDLTSSGGLVRQVRLATVPVAADYTVAGIDAAVGPLSYENGKAFLKGDGPPATQAVPSTDLPALDLRWLTGDAAAPATFGGTAQQPIGAQGGAPDWPLVPLSDDATETSGFLVQVLAGTTEANGFTADATTPWISSSLLAAPLTPPTTTPPATAPTDPNTPGATTPAATSSRSTGGGIVLLIMIVVAGAAIIATYVVLSRKQRPQQQPMTPPVPPPPEWRVRTDDGPSTHTVSEPSDSWSIGVRVQPDSPTIVDVREPEEAS